MLTAQILDRNPFHILWKKPPTANALVTTTDKISLLHHHFS
jgi:hypothetical protein